MPSGNPSSIQVAKTCEALMKFSNKVTIITPNTGLKTSLKNFYGLNLEPIILKIKYFKKFPLGINYYLYSLLSILYAIKIKTDIFYTRNLFTLFLLRFFRLKSIVEIHHDFSVESRIVKFLYNKFDIFNSDSIIKIIVITKPVKEYLIKSFKVNSKKIQIIPSSSSINLKFKKLGKKKVYNIGYFGSLEASKGSEFIIKLSKLDKFNNYFIYGGNIEQIKKLKKKIKNKNLSINKFLPYNKVDNYIDRMDVLLMPSDSKLLKATGGIGNLAKYTSPLKLFDYLASGKVIILSNLSVFKEIVQHNKNCIFIKNLKPIIWMNTINKLKENINFINKIKQNAFLLSKKYTYDKRAEKILDF